MNLIGICRIQILTNIFLFLLQQADSKLEKTFTKVSDKLREKVRFAHSSAADVISKAGQKEDTLVLFRPKNLANKFEPDTLVYDGALDREDIEKFVTTNL